eukprot:5326466-Lingulodinium_polyedra.AAC.1
MDVALQWLQALPVAQAALGAAIAAILTSEGKQRQLLLQRVARGAVRGTAERPTQSGDGGA